MAKIKTILEINFGKGNIVQKDSFIQVSEEMAIFLCCEGEYTINRSRKAIRTPIEDKEKVHLDYLSM